MSKMNYIPSLDGLRSVSIVLVLLAHGSYGFVTGGWIGVDIFFVLSGYLITSLLKEEYNKTGKVVLSKFYLKRIVRLVPALLIAIILNNILWNSISINSVANRQIATLSSLLYAANCVKFESLGSFVTIWSLSVEEHFYFMWPPLLSVFLLAYSKKNQIVFILSIIAATWITRLFITHYIDGMNVGFFTIYAYSFTFCRIDTILLGAAMALLTDKQFRKISMLFNNTFSAVITSLFICFVALSVSHLNSYWRNGGFILTDVLCISIMLFALNNTHNYILSNRLAKWIGQRSYGIYLYHYPIFLALESFRRAHDSTNLIVITPLRFTLTLIIAYISYKYVELPILTKYGRAKLLKPVLQ
jgi:peptidoglycan/LPS O-acetylase OafA/YrhL